MAMAPVLVPGPKLVIDDFAIEAEARRKEAVEFGAATTVAAPGEAIPRDTVPLVKTDPPLGAIGALGPRSNGGGRVRVRWGRVAALAVVTLLAGVGAFMALRDTAGRLEPTSPARDRTTAVADTRSVGRSTLEPAAETGPQPGDFRGLEEVAPPPPAPAAPEQVAPAPQQTTTRRAATSSRSATSASSSSKRKSSNTATFNHFQGSGGMRGPSYPSWFGSRQNCGRASCSR